MSSAICQLATKGSRAARRILGRDWNPDQPRDPDGKFSEGGGGGGGEGRGGSGKLSAEQGHQRMAEVRARAIQSAHQYLGGSKSGVKAEVHSQLREEAKQHESEAAEHQAAGRSKEAMRSRSIANAFYSHAEKYRETTGRSGDY